MLEWVLLALNAAMVLALALQVRDNTRTLAAQQAELTKLVEAMNRITRELTHA